MSSQERDHGGGLDKAIAQHGGTRAQWIDLSTGINPAPYPIGEFTSDDWTALPDATAFDALNTAARQFWNVPAGAAMLPAPGASSLIARIPALAPPSRVGIPTPTYNEHAAAFSQHGWALAEDDTFTAQVLVHPNNPDGRLWQSSDVTAPLTIIDESFCDIAPNASLMHLAEREGVIILKSFGKFWGLAGLRLGFAIAHPSTIASLSALIGPWPVSGPALEVATRALSDPAWAAATRTRLAQDSARLDRLMAPHSSLVGGTTLFRLYAVPDAHSFQTRLAQHQIWSRIFPYSSTWIRLGLPPAARWSALEAAL